MMRHPIHTIFAILLAMLLAGVASVAAAQMPAAKDGMLVNATGMTLYTFENDSGGKSICIGTCAKNWPPVAAAEKDQAQGDYAVIKREDGTRQWSYKGKPLYTFAQDKKPGDKG